MALVEAETLRTIAEVAVAIAGFTGIVVVFGGRAGGDWSPDEAERLWLLLSQALVVTLFAFLPILLQAAGLEGPAIWRLSNGLLGITIWGIGANIAFRQRHFERVRAASLLTRCFEYATSAAGACISISLVAHSAGALATRGPFLFLFALLFLLAASIMNFWRLLMGSVVAGRHQA